MVVFLFLWFFQTSTGWYKCYNCVDQYDSLCQFLLVKYILHFVISDSWQRSHSRPCQMCLCDWTSIEKKIHLILCLTASWGGTPCIFTPTSSNCTCNFFFQRIFRQTYHLQNLLWLGHSVSESVVVSCNLIFMAGETSLKSLTLEAASIWRREETRVAGRLVQLNPTLQKDKVLDESESGRWEQLIPNPPKRSKYLPLKFCHSPE